MTKKYIDANELIENLEASCMPIHEKGISGILGDEKSIVDIIQEQPAADVQEVRHGKWEIDCDGYYPYCSNCKETPKNSVMITKYCPNCGARMDGEENG